MDRPTVLSRLRLREFFDRVFAPQFLVGAAPATLRGYRETLAHWRRCTKDPPLAEITGETLSLLKARLQDPANFPPPRDDRPRTLQLELFPIRPQRPRRRGRPPKPLSRASTNKHLRHIGAILAKAGPPGPHNRDALGVLPTVPWTKPVREYRRLPRAVSDEPLAAVYRACAYARYPRLEEPVGPQYREHWWKALITTALLVGFRRGALLDLQWPDVDLPSKKIRLPAEADKCRSERLKPITSLVVAHLVRIRTPGPLVFPWPQSQSTFYRQWHRLQDAAGIAPEQHFGLHDLKRACGTRLATVASPWAVQHQLDHRSIHTARHYINPIEELQRAVERMPVPDALMADFL